MSETAPTDPPATNTRATDSRPTEPRPHGPWRRPPWWPDNEEWPPPDWRGPPWGRGGWRGGEYRRGWGPGGMHGFRRPFGCLVVLLAIFATGTFTLGLWALGALLGLVTAPRAVVVGGVLALLFVAIAAATVGRTVRRMVAPMDDLVDAAARIEAGDYSVRVRERGNRQMRSLARAFNGMTARLADLDQRRRTFLADVAHELRTPLSVIAGQLEGIEDGLYPADAEHLAPIAEQVKALDKLIDDLRTVALAEAGSLSLERKPTDLGALAEEVVASFAGQPATAGLSIRADIDESLPQVNVDAGRIRQVLVNLVSNAVRHVPPDGRVTVTVRRPRAGEAAGSIVIDVADNGSGIPVDLLPAVFDRFVKDPASPGSGLGLAIARDLVTAHGGTIAAFSPAGQGTTIRLTLPT